MEFQKLQGSNLRKKVKYIYENLIFLDRMYNFQFRQAIKQN